MSGITADTGRQFTASLLPSKLWSLFCLWPNLKAPFLTSGEEKIGGLLAAADPEAGAELSTLPGDSGWARAC